MFKLRNIVLLLITILICSLTTQASTFNFNSIELNKPSDKDVFAPKSITFIDESATDQLKEEASQSNQDVYEHDKSVYSKIDEDMEIFLNSLTKTKENINKVIKAENSKPVQNRTINIEEFKKAEIAKISNPFAYTDNQLLTFLTVDDTALKRLTSQLLKELHTILYVEGVTNEKLDYSKTRFQDSADNLMFYTSGQLEKVSPTIVTALTNRIVVNFSLNEEETKKKKEEAIKNVEPVYKQVVKGELIVGQGVKVTEDTYQKLKELGLLETEFQYKDYFFQIPYIALILVLFHLYCFKFFEKYFNKFRVYIYLLLSIFILLLSANFIDDLRYFLGILTVFMLIGVVIWGRMFIISYTIILGLLIYSGEFVYAATTIITGIIIALHYKPDGERMELIKTGFVIGVVFVFTQIIFKFSIDQDLTSLSVDLKHNFWFIVSTSASAIATIGIIPVIEKTLGIVTYFRLHEFNKHSHPLIKQLIMEAPGTYDHSIKVGNLAELAADRIGANGLLVRVGAYYHDIGKTLHPEFFIENTSPSTNPHNHMDPIDSAKAITSHPKDGVKLAREYKLPDPIVRMIYSHHSDSLLAHFYSKAKETDPDIDINLFRYNCPTPKSKEEGILMLADSTEAYSRVLLEKNLSKEELENAIRKSIYTKVSNGDLRDCDLTLDELEKIILTFVNYLSKSNHKRIAYKTKEND